MLKNGIGNDFVKFSDIDTFVKVNFDMSCFGPKLYFSIKI